MMARKKTALERQLEESIRRVKKGQHKPSALADRLRKMDRSDLPDSLTCPECREKPCICEDQP